MRELLCALVVTLAAPACVVPDPDYSGTQLSCGGDEVRCPDGFDCSDEGRCVPGGGEGEGEGPAEGEGEGGAEGEGEGPAEGEGEGPAEGEGEGEGPDEGEGEGPDEGEGEGEGPAEGEGEGPLPPFCGLACDYAMGCDDAVSEADCHRRCRALAGLVPDGTLVEGGTCFYQLGCDEVRGRVYEALDDCMRGLGCHDATAQPSDELTAQICGALEARAGRCELPVPGGGEDDGCQDAVHGRLAGEGRAGLVPCLVDGHPALVGGCVAGAPCEELDPLDRCLPLSGGLYDGPELTPSECTDGIDNDGDGLIDAADHCSPCPSPADRGPEEGADACVDGLDNDCNGYVDCRDHGCRANEACCPPEADRSEEVGARCDDGVDNDCNGFTDCQDDACRPDEVVPEICDDGIDNDCDGFTDCVDWSCQPAEADVASVCCPAARDRVEDEDTDELCSDGIDNDCNGFIDCDDRNCWPDPRWRGAAVSVCVDPDLRENTLERCADGVDNDGDELADCDEPSCADLPCGAPEGPPPLLVSEYVEGSGGTRAIEVFNASDLATPVADCAIRIYADGGHEVTVHVPFSPPEARLDPRGVFVVCHGDLAAEGSAHCDDSGNLVFDGDDAVTLECGGAILDAIGRIGERPGPAWGQGDTSTRDRTLRRRCGIEEGDTNAADAFDPTDEWEGLPEDTVEGLGEHTVACPG